MTEQAHKTQSRAAQTSLTKLCDFLKENGHPIEGELAEHIDTLQRALNGYYQVTDKLGRVQGTIHNFFNEQ